MPQIWPIIIAVFTAFLIVLAIYLRKAKNTKQTAQLIEKQELQDGTVIMTFLLPKGKNSLDLKVGQMISISIQKSSNQQSKIFTPIESGKGSFKILLVPILDEDNNKDDKQFTKQLKDLCPKDNVCLKVVQSNLHYVGNSQIRMRTAGNKQFSKKFNNIYILAQGNKIQIAYNVIKKICQEKTECKPKITVFFVGGGISDFVLKNQFQHLQDNYSNVQYFYSLPIKGERQPSVAGMGISSEKVVQSFKSDKQQTLCILCSEQTDLTAVVERTLLNMKIPADHIYKF